MKIMYLSWGETPRSYGVFGSQVIEQLVEISAAMPATKFLFVAAVPVIHSGLVREKFRYFNELKKIREKLGKIEFKWISITTTQNFINPNRITFKLMFLGAMKNFQKTIENFQPDIIHCRSYLAAWAALKVREENQKQFRIVFDPRGLYPEEVALKNDNNIDSLNYKFLKSIENRLLSCCDVTIAVSDTMARHFCSLNANAVETIYISADTSSLNSNRKIKLNASKKINFCYVGALNESTWHKTSALYELFLRLKQLYQYATLTIVTTSNHDSIRYHFRKYSSSDVKIVAAHNRDEVRSNLELADFGLLTYFVPRSRLEILLASMVIAVKTAEYLCAGIPVIVNKYCGGAAAVLKKYQLGVLYDPEDLNSLSSHEIEASLMQSPNKMSIVDQSRQLFDYKVNAKKYSDIYIKYR